MSKYLNVPIARWRAHEDQVHMKILFAYMI